MSFSTDVVNGLLVVKVEIPRATVEIAGEFKNELIKHIEIGNIKVVVDLSNAEFVDSSFLGALVTGLKRSRMSGGDLRIVGLQPSVRSMFELTRLYRIFTIFDRTEDAIDSF